MGIRNSLKKIKSLLKFDYEIAQGNIIDILKKMQHLESLEKENAKESANIKYKINKLSDDLEKIIKNFNYVNLETLQLNNFKTTGKQKLLICGFYGAVNLGDELMLETLLKYIDETNRFDVTIMLCDNQYVNITRYGKYNFIHYPINSVDLNNIANYYDCLIFGGGAHLDDIDYDNNKHLSMGRILTDLTMRFITFEKKTVIYGLSSNEKITNPEFISKLKYIVDNSTLFALRDKYSIETLKKCGVDTSKIKLVDDIVFADDYKTIERKDKKTIEIGAIFICNHETENKIENYLNSIEKYLKKVDYKYHINLIPFYDYNDNDNYYYNNIIKRIKSNKINIMKMPYNMNQLQELFNENDCIISMRYHATLIANIMNKNVLNIVYSSHQHYTNKMRYIYDNYKYDNNTINFGEQIDDNIIKKLLSFENNKNNKMYNNKAKKDLIDMIKLM